MEVTKYRKKPVVIEAVQVTKENAGHVAEWCKGMASTMNPVGVSLIVGLGLGFAEVGDWIIKGVEGEFYPCPASVFDATYERVES